MNGSALPVRRRTLGLLFFDVTLLVGAIIVVPPAFAVMWTLGRIERALLKGKENT
jgi:hypothetical protein